MLALAAALLASPVLAADGPELTPLLFVHIRPEARTNPGFVAGQDDTRLSVGQTGRVGVEAHKGIFTGRIELLGTQAWGTRAGSTSAEPTAFAYTSWIQVGSDDSWLRFGRQELHLLNGFYMSKAPWNLFGRTFDGVRAHHETDSLRIDAFSVLLRAPQPASEDVEEPSLGATQAGLFATWTGSDTLEPTFFALARFEGPTADDPDQSKWWIAPAARLAITSGETSVDANAMVQIGDHTGVPIRAWNTIVRARQGLDSAWKPGVGLIFEQDSGHACQSSSDTGWCDTDVIQDMDFGFARNHFLRGNADQFHGSNLRDMGVELDTTPWAKDKTHRLKLMAQGHFFQMVNPEGTWRSISGDLQGAGWELGNTDPNLAWEVDALMDWKLGKGVHIDGGLCVVQPIGVGARLTGDDAMTYAFARNRFQF